MSELQFARVRDAFHSLMALDLAARAAEVEALRRTNPDLHAELERLLSHLDEVDLLPELEPSRLGERLGPFELIRLIGSGGMGEVYEARRVEADFEQRVALKMIRTDGLSAELKRRFVRERQLLARLTHPHIAHLLDGGVDAAGHPWLALEYVDGLSIVDWCNAQNLSVSARVALFQQVCAAVGFAHDQLIVHRDLKPANVLIDASGCAKLLDFGIAKLLQVDEGAPLTALNALTPRYAAPEQIGAQPATLTTDVYALGNLLFEVLSGGSAYPRAQSGAQSWAAAHLNEAPASLRSVALNAQPRGVNAQHLDHRLDAILRRALAKIPAKRYLSVSALSADLDDWLQKRALRSGAGGTFDDARMLLRRYRFALSATLLLLLALTVGLIAARTESAAATRQRISAERNFDALLSVLSAASPRDFVGREPLASEQLLNAAQAVRSFAEPGLKRRALTQIGVGLLNLNHQAKAESVLGEALRAALLERAPGDTQLELLKLLAYSQVRPESLDRLQQTAAAVNALAQLNPSATAIEALASSASALSSLAEFDAADAMFAEMDRLIASGVRLEPSMAENAWRQRARSAMHRADGDQAWRWWQASIAEFDLAPAAFSELRRAEAWFGLAEAAALRNQLMQARQSLDQARPTLQREYSTDHVEFAAVNLLEARIALLAGNPAAALAFLGAASPGAQGHDQTVHSLLRSIALAELKRCAGAKLSLSGADTSTLQLPREQLLKERAKRAVERFCPLG